MSSFHESFVHYDFSDFVFEGVDDFVKRDLFHIRTYLHVSGSVEYLVRVFLFELIENAHFGGNEEFFVVAFCRIVDDAGCASHIVCKFSDFRAAFRVYEQQSIGTCLFRFDDLFAQEIVMHVAVFVIEDEILFRELVCYVMCEVLVGDEIDVLFGRAFTIFSAFDEVTHTSLCAFSSAVEFT